MTCWLPQADYNDTAQSHSSLRHAWIQDVADTVPEKIDGQHGKQNSDAREGGELPGDVNIVSSQGDHLAPGRIGLACAKPQEAQSCLS
jgi:hypothetical protein